MISATKRKTEAAVEGKPATFDDILVRHACAASAIDCNSKPNVSKDAAQAFDDACRALIRTPADQPLQIAYKLREAFTDMVEEPDVFLDAATALDVVTDDGATHDVALIASAFLDLSAMDSRRRASGATTETEAAFNAALEAHRAAHRQDGELLRAVEIAAAQVETEAPTPPDLRMKSGGAYYRADLIEDAHDLTFAQKVDLLAVLREWRPRRDAAEERSGYRKANDAWSEFDTDRAFEAVIETPAPTPEALAEKLRIYLSRVHADRKSQDVDSPETLSELLSDPDWCGPAPIVRIYQDTLRMAGRRPELTTVQPFDADAWTDAFVALPGHSIGFNGPAYQHPEAWPVGTPTSDELTVRDPEILSLLYAGEEPGFDICKGVTLSRGSADRVRRKLADRPEERDRLLEIISRDGRKPVGSEMWDALAPWQQRMVLSTMRERCQDAAAEARAAITGSAVA